MLKIRCYFQQNVLIFLFFLHETHAVVLNEMLLMIPMSTNNICF